MPNRAPRVAIAAVSILAVSALPKLSLAYNCSPAKACPIGQQWFTRQVKFFINDTSPLLQGEERKQLVESAFGTWSSQSCTDIKFNDQGYTTMGAAFDETNLANNQNVILAAASETDLEMFDSPDELAKTIVTFIADTGQIVDADMMLNGINRPFDEVSDQAICQQQRPKPYDLLETITHEAGHFMGFDHSPFADSAMFATADPCETKKRHPTPDDVMGLCTVYPAGAANGHCAPERFMHPCAPTSCFCSARESRGTSSTPISLLLCALVLIVRASGKR